ncbi:O-antigen ligase family protein [Gracilibacillus marinus]|uniref:O-antigen ligase family protein n=1 Tax=Gracilibacillus marinus TaxID=630535 RepID=A0ABV8VX83_9BACI
MSSFSFRQRRINIIGIIALVAIALTIGVSASIYSTSFFFLAILTIIAAFLVILMITKTENTMVFLVTLLLISLFLIPGFSVAGIGVRLDDAIVICLAMLVIVMFIKESQNIQTPINKWIIIYCIYVMSITLINIILNNLSLIYMFYFIKEVQYFIYFFAFVYVMKNKWFRKKFKNILLFLILLSMGWGFYQLLFDASVGYYGIGLVSVTASSQTGGVYFLISIFSLYLINTEKTLRRRVFYFILFMSSSGLLFATISRTAILAFVLTYVVYLFFMLFRMSVRRVLIWVYVTLMAAPLIYLVIKDYLPSISERLGRMDEGANTRTAKWDYLLSFSSDIGAIFGEGRGFVQTITGGLTLSADSQYIRNILELGYIGSALFLFIILSLLIFAFKNMKSFYGESLFLILSTCGFLIMSITHEVFLVTIQASFYWVLVGIFVGKIIHRKKDEEEIIDNNN